MAVPEIPSVKDTNGIVRFLREAKSEWVIDSIFAGLFQLILQ